MNDLISRQATIDAIDNVDWYHQDRNKDMVLGANPPEHQAWYKEGDIYKAIENVPTIEERKTGWWVYEPGMYMCSECWDAWAEEQAEEVMSFNYCPNCGARIARGEEHG